jgi:hypothetical protein
MDFLKWKTDLEDENIVEPDIIIHKNHTDKKYTPGIPNFLQTYFGI